MFLFVFFFRHGSFTGRRLQQSRLCVLQHSGFFAFGLEAARFYPLSPTPKSTPKAGICKFGRGGSRSGGASGVPPPESQLASGRGIAREGPKGKGAGAAYHKMPGSPVQLHRGDASHRKAKRRCLAQSSVLKKPGIGGVNQPQVCRESSGLWAPLQPGAGKRGKGYHPFRVSEAFGSFLPGCSLSLYKAQSQALAGDNLAKTTDAHGEGIEAGIREQLPATRAPGTLSAALQSCSHAVFGIPGTPTQMTISSFMLLKPTSSL